MGEDNNLASCLELLEDQGFKAEHQLLIKLFRCINEYCKQGKVLKDNTGTDQNSIDLSGRVPIEEGEIALEDEIISAESDLRTTSGKQNFQRDGGKHKNENKLDVPTPLIPQSETALQQEFVSSELKLETDQENKATEVLYVTKPQPSTFDCKYCSFTLPGTKKGRMFSYQLRKHNKAEHHVCEICRKKNPNKGDLEAHMETEHKDSEGLVCGIEGCNARAPRKHPILMLIKHVEYAHDRVPSICRYCNKSYSSEKSCRKHERLHSVDPNSLHTCKECDYVCLSEKYMKTHKTLFHSTSKPENVLRPKNILSCNLCNFKTNGLSQDEEYRLMVHKSIHQEGQISCDFCSFKSTKRFTLKRHLAEEHGMGKVLHCNQCNYKTGGHTGESHMNTHKATHSKEKPFLCDKCEFSSRSKESLKGHMQRHDPTTPKYLCDGCDYKSSDRGNFAAHRTVKHGTVVLSCALCDYNTKSKRSLREHTKKHTASTG